MLFDTVASIGSYVGLLFIVCLLVKKVMRVNTMLIVPFALIFLTFGLYVTNLILNNPLIIFFLTLAIVLGLSTLAKDLDPNFEKKYYSKKVIVAILALVIFITLPRLIYVVCSFRLSECFPFHTHLDEQKHLAVLTSIATQKTFLPFPNKPDVLFPYYYFFYLYPGILLRLFAHSYKQIIWTVHVSLSYAALLTTFFYIIQRLITNRAIKTLTFLLFIFGSSLKILPLLVSKTAAKHLHIDVWYLPSSEALVLFSEKVGWQITHPITNALWLPQHLFATMVGLCLYTVTLFFKRNIRSALLIGIILATLTGSSVFIGFGTVIMFSIFMLYEIKYRKKIFQYIASLFIFAIFIVPFVLTVKNNHAALTFQPYLPTVPNIPFLLSSLVFYIVETGFLIPVLIYLTYLYVSKRNYKEFDNFFYLILFTFVPLIISRLFKTSFFNDFGMRTSQYFVYFSPLLFAFLMEKINLSKAKLRIVLSTVLLCVYISAMSGGVEVLYRIVTAKTLEYSLSHPLLDIEKHTTKNDIIISNYPLLNTIIPIAINRLSLSKTFSMDLDVFIKKPEYYAKKNESDVLCKSFAELTRKNMSYNFVYAEFSEGKPLTCFHMKSQKESLIYKSNIFTLYRIF